MDPELLLAARLATWDVVGLLVCRVFSVLVSIGIWVCLLIVVLCLSKIVSGGIS